MSALTEAARDLLLHCDDWTRRDAILMAAEVRDRGINLDDCELYDIGLESAVVLPAWWADDGNCAVEYEYADSGRKAAEEYVSDGDWGDDGGAVDVWVWRVALLVRAGAIVEYEVDRALHSVDIEPDHSSLIAAEAGLRIGDLCGDDPDDHDWSSEDEGGCDSNPGVWSLGGTAMLFTTHCRHCGLRRSVVDPGSQRNPGEGVTYRYEWPEATA